MDDVNGAKSSFFQAAACAGVLSAVAFASPAQADQTAADAQIAVVRPLEFIKVEDLRFGQVLRGGTAGTVVLAPSGTRTKTGGVTLMGTTSQPARFAGMGTPGQLVSISLGANQIFITGPGAPMRVRNFVIGSTPTANLSSSALFFTIASSTGIFNFPVGATLDVGANQTPGTYTGNWNITLNYQ